MLLAWFYTLVLQYLVLLIRWYCRYPSLNEVNSNVGTRAELYSLAAESLRYNVIISYHINTDGARTPASFLPRTEPAQDSVEV